MDKAKMEQQRHEVLTALNEQFADELIPARLLNKEAEEEGTGTEILSVLFENLAVDGGDVFGEFFFSPISDNDELQVFQNVLTLDDEVSEENTGELLLAASIVNTYLPVGAFIVDVRGKSLVYRHGYEMPLSLTDEEVRTSVDICIGAAMQMVERFGYLLAEVALGERDAESVSQI